MEKPTPPAGGSNRRMRRFVDLLMAVVCVSIVVKGCRDTKKSELLADQPFPADSVPVVDASSDAATVLQPGKGFVSPGTFQLSHSRMADGRRAYVKSCGGCHQSEGEGIASLFPPLAKSDYLMADKERSIRIILLGQTGEIVVNEQRYNGAMPPIPLKDEQIANVLSYIRNSWGNHGDPVTIEEVRKVRAEISGQPSLADAR